jgi:hypothetical protein
MARDNLVQRLIAFLKKPDALHYDEQEPVSNPYDDYQPQAVEHPDDDPAGSEIEAECSAPAEAEPGRSLVNGNGRLASQASRLDALVMRALQQFNAQQGFVIRHEPDDTMRYCTGRTLRGDFVPYHAVDLDRRAVFLALDSGESQFFVHTNDEQLPLSVLCGPLWYEDRVIGVLYIDNPARSRLHRGLFDLFCEQAARLLVRESS